MANPTSEPIDSTGEFAVHRHERASSRVQRVVARVANHRVGDRRDAHLREQAIDVQLILGIDARVEELGAPDTVAGHERGVLAEQARPVDARLLPTEAEARANGLLHERRHVEVGAVEERARLSPRPEHAVLVEGQSGAIAFRVTRVVPRSHARAQEQAEGPVLPPQVAATGFEEPARRELEVLLDLAGLGHGPQALTALQACTVTHRRHGRLLDGDDDVMGVDVGLPDVDDPHAAEEAEGREAALALEDAAQAERLSADDAELSPDGVLAGAHVADDEDAIDDRLPALDDRERDRDGAHFLVGLEARLDLRLPVAVVEVAAQHGLAAGDDRSRRERLACRDGQRRAQRRLVERLHALEPDS